VIVVGYLEHRIREFLGEWQGSLSIEYVVNPQYGTTNNLYSLYLARDAVQESFLLLESDLLFEPSLLDDLQPADKIAVSSMQPGMNGSTVTVDHSQHVREFQLGEMSDVDGLRYKTVNICSLSLWSWRRVIERLGQYVASGQVNEFYERVFADMVADGSLDFEAVFFDPRPGTKSTPSRTCRKSNCSSNLTAENRPLPPRCNLA
jgi:NDP-sugar pyrophosphorylase family protein